MREARGSRGFLSSLLLRAGLLSLVLLGVAEWEYRNLASGGALPGALPRPVALRMLLRLSTYGHWRNWLLDNAWLVVLGGLATALLVVLALRQVLLLSNRLTARVSGTAPREAPRTFPGTKVDVLRQIARRPAGHLFVGMTPKRTRLGWRWKPVYLSAEQRSTHRHVIGKTGSGKTMSVLWPSVLQDALDGKGVLLMSGKGSDEELRTMKAIAALANRTDALRVFSLPAWNVPQLFTHTYNMLYVRPRTATSAGGDPVGDGTARLLRASHGRQRVLTRRTRRSCSPTCVDSSTGWWTSGAMASHSVLRDVSVCLKAIGNVGRWGRALQHCLDSSVERDVAEEIKAHIRQLDHDVLKTLSGLVGALEKYQSPIVNAYAPDIVFEDVLQSNGLVYVQLPANLFRLQAPALGKLILMDVQQEGSLRQVFRHGTQPDAVLGRRGRVLQLRGPLHRRQPQQATRRPHRLHPRRTSPSRTSNWSRKQFATAVWDNTCTKDILHQDNPELCERIAKSLGTHRVLELTVRRRQGLC